MFGLVDIQDTLPNLHGLEIFNKIFKRPHSTFAGGFFSKIVYNLQKQEWTADIIIICNTFINKFRVQARLG